VTGSSRTSLTALARSLQPPRLVIFIAAVAPRWAARTRRRALSLCELLANVDPARYERAALRWLQRFIDERLQPLTEVALAASALAESRHGRRNIGIKTLHELIR
jgi:ribosomal protein S7